MTRLILMRHAKSDWGDVALEDHERPLNKRGRRSATALGVWLREKGYSPDLVLCSTAERTQETHDLLKLNVPATLRQDLYLAGPQVLWAAARDAQIDGTVLVLAHNPGIGALAAAVARPSPDHSRFFDYPTGATLVLDVADFDSATGNLVDFTVPRDLT